MKSLFCQLFPDQHPKDLVQIKYRNSVQWKISGFISKHLCSSKLQQFLIINGRVAESPQVTNTIEQALSKKIQGEFSNSTTRHKDPGQANFNSNIQIAFVLRIELPQDQLTFSINETRAFVSFASWKLVEKLLFKALFSAIGDLDPNHVNVNESDCPTCHHDSMPPPLPSRNRVVIGSAMNSKQLRKTLDANSEWKNPVFQTAPPPLPNMISNSQDANKITWSFSKSNFEQLDIIGQLDDSFIMCSLPWLRSDLLSQQLLISIDQHAADERVKLEQIWRESLSEFPLPSTQLPNFHSVSLSTKQLLSFNNYGLQLKCWGLTVSKAEDDACAEVTIQSVPSVAYDKCIENENFLEHLLVDHLDWLTENPRQAQLTVASNSSLSQKLLLCPILLKEYFNSKACRSAIMFHHPLSKTECEELIGNLSKCEYPFQCAHGRPSLIPICFYP